MRPRSGGHLRADGRGRALVYSRTDTGALPCGSRQARACIFLLYELMCSKDGTMQPDHGVSLAGIYTAEEFGIAFYHRAAEGLS